MTEEKQKIHEVRQDLSHVADWIESGGGRDNHVRVIRRGVELILELEAQRNHFAEENRGFAAERAPDALETLAKDRDHWWKLATQLEAEVVKERARSHKFENENRRLRTALSYALEEE